MAGSTCFGSLTDRVSVCLRATSGLSVKPDGHPERVGPRLLVLLDSSLWSDVLLHLCMLSGSCLNMVRLQIRIRAPRARNRRVARAARLRARTPRESRNASESAARHAMPRSESIFEARRSTAADTVGDSPLVERTQSSRPTWSAVGSRLRVPIAMPHILGRARSGMCCVGRFHGGRCQEGATDGKRHDTNRCQVGEHRSFTGLRIVAALQGVSVTFAPALPLLEVAGEDTSSAVNGSLCPSASRSMCWVPLFHFQFSNRVIEELRRPRETA